jgi:hypothetical protein
MAKRARAQHHFDTLDVAVRDFFANHPYTLAIEPDPDHNRYVIRLHGPFPIPDTEWATIIGDCVHNLRAIFDYIAWELAGGNPTDRQTQFPIYDTEEGFKERGARQIRRLPEETQVLIEKIQPYHGHSLARDPHRHALWPLHLLDINDKHKLLTLTVAQPIAAALRFLPPSDIRYDVRLVQDAVFENNAEIAEITLERFVANMTVEAHASFDVAFDASLGLGPRQSSLAPSR